MPRSFALAALFALLIPTFEIASAHSPMPTLGLDALLLPNAVELGLELPEPAPKPAPIPACERPEPSSKWANRASDHAWIPGSTPYLGSGFTTAERDAFARAVNRTGMTMVMWSAGTGDSDPHLSSDERHDPVRVAEATRKAANRGGVFVAHDRINPKALRAMLDEVERSDVEVVTLEHLRRIKLGCG